MDAHKHHLVSEHMHHSQLNYQDAFRLLFYTELKPTRVKCRVSIGLLKGVCQCLHPASETQLFDSKKEKKNPPKKTTGGPQWLVSLRLRRPL